MRPTETGNTIRPGSRLQDYLMMDLLAFGCCAPLRLLEACSLVFASGSPPVLPEERSFGVLLILADLTVGITSFVMAHRAIRGTRIRAADFKLAIGATLVALVLRCLASASFERHAFIWGDAGVLQVPVRAAWLAVYVCIVVRSHDAHGSGGPIPARHAD